MAVALDKSRSTELQCILCSCLSDGVWHNCNLFLLFAGLVDVSLEDFTVQTPPICILFLVLQLAFCCADPRHFHRWRVLAMAGALALFCAVIPVAAYCAPPSAMFMLHPLLGSFFFFIVPKSFAAAAAVL